MKPMAAERAPMQAPHPIPSGAVGSAIDAAVEVRFLCSRVADAFEQAALVLELAQDATEQPYAPPRVPVVDRCPRSAPDRRSWELEPDPRETPTGWAEWLKEELDQLLAIYAPCDPAEPKDRLLRVRGLVRRSRATKSVEPVSVGDYLADSALAAADVALNGFAIAHILLAGWLHPQEVDRALTCDPFPAPLATDAEKPAFAEVLRQVIRAATLDGLLTPERLRHLAAQVTMEANGAVEGTAAC